MRISFDVQEFIDMLNALNCKSDYYYEYQNPDDDFDNILCSIVIISRSADIIVSKHAVFSSGDFIVYLTSELRKVREDKR